MSVPHHVVKKKLLKDYKRTDKYICTNVYIMQPLIVLTFILFIRLVMYS